jgi:hypothetical protein
VLTDNIADELKGHKDTETMTTEDWQERAVERGLDASAIVEKRPNSICAIYVAGYAVECSLKAYLASRKIKFSTSGKSGHDIKGLWDSTGFRLSDIYDINGVKTYYISQWSTALRYEITVPNGYSASELVLGAQKLASWILTRTKRNEGNR